MLSYNLLFGGQLYRKPDRERAARVVYLCTKMYEEVLGIAIYTSTHPRR